MRSARTDAFFKQTTPAAARLDSEEDLEALIARTARIYVQAVTEQTRATYVRRWRHFEHWAAQHRLQSLPASSETLMLYLSDGADGPTPCSLSTLRGRAAAINRIHVEAGFRPPGDDPGMSLLMRGLGRTLAPRR